MRIGIIGGGQLARMLALAGYPLGFRFTVLDPSAEACAAQVVDFIQGAYDDPEALQQLAAQVDLVTFDFENVPVAAMEKLQQQLPVYPPAKALAVSQDRLQEKTLCRELGIPTAEFAAVNDPGELKNAVETLGLPAVLKTRRLGYDGKGQRWLKTITDLDSAWEELGKTPLILESVVPFEREVSILAVRNQQGETAFYPLTENRHEDGILRLSKAPYDDAEMTTLARQHTEKLLRELDYVGLLAIEFFVVDGQLLVNEMAPRVHNSGHWTIEGAQTSQFENHLRAISGLPLGSTDSRGYSAMLNFIGEISDISQCLEIANAHFHDYGKTPRPGRKVGHLTVSANTAADLEKALKQIAAYV